MQPLGTTSVRYVVVFLNPALVDMMEVMGITENRYSGVPTMRREMQSFGLPPPKFVNRNGEFRAILRNGLGAVVADSPQAEGAGQGSSVELTEREKRLLEFYSEPRTRAEVVGCLGVSHYYAFSKIVGFAILCGQQLGFRKVILIHDLS